jgi:hypothetical protein
LAGSRDGVERVGSVEGRPQDGDGVIGVATYRIEPDGSLDGVWTVPRLAGRLGRELVTGGMLGQLAGIYRVGTYDPDGQPFFHGTLEIVPEG